jgi:hypothetical protein
MTFSFGWQYPPEHITFVQTAVAPDPDPDPGFGTVTTVYEYASGHQLLYYMPDYLQHDAYIRDLMDAMGEEISVLRAALDRVLEQFFVNETVDWGLRLWEQMAGVAVAPDNVSTADRRAAVLSRIIIGPRTLADFEAFIRSYFDGVDGVITENYATYDLDVTVYAYKTPEEQAAFEAAFEAALPAHLTVTTYTYGGFVPGVSVAGDTL